MLQTRSCQTNPVTENVYFHGRRARIDPVLSVRDLRVEFQTRHGKLVAADGISFDLQPGEILGMVGESGAGKSLTGMAVSGLIEKPGFMSGGQIFLQGRRIDCLSQAERQSLRGRKIGSVFQNPLTSLHPLFTIGQQLIETIRFNVGVTGRRARVHAIDLLAKVGIPNPAERLNLFPHQFSGGMRQRIVIALAIAGNPCVLIADEPTTALDVSIQAQITTLLKKICRDQAAGVLLITHDMGVVAETADRVAVMYAGRIVELGPVADVLRAPMHPYTQGLISAIPNLRKKVGRLSQVDGAMPRLDNMPSGCAFHPRCNHAGPRCVSDRPVMNRAGTSEVMSACWLHQGGCQ